jgi:hypothetical protein
MLMDLKEFQALPPLRQLFAIGVELEACSARAGENMLTAGTWVEQSFLGAAQRLHDVAERLSREPD